MKKMETIKRMIHHLPKLNSMVFLCLMGIVSSCRKDIQVKLPEYTQKLVIEASIETGQTAQVFLSFTAPYFGNIDLSDPTQLFVKGALVIVTDGIQTDTLIEPDPSTGYFYIGTKIIGQVGRSYQLLVKVNDKTYTSNTTILDPIALDSLFFEVDRDSVGYCGAYLTDPPGQGNCYRWFAKSPSDQFYAPPFNSAFDDKFIDGKRFSFSYARPTQRNPLDTARTTDPDGGLYEVGDTVMVKFCTMGQKEYLFWRSYYTNKTSNSNPFSAPANIQSTINGGDAIGAFTGYSPSFDTLIIK